MTPAAIMLDVDGVLVVHPDARGWTAHLHRDLGIPVAELQSAFFARHWDDVVHGRASLRDRLGLVLRDRWPATSCDQLIDYWFSHDAHLDHALLADVQALRLRGIEIHLATVQEHERAAYLWTDLDLRSRFDGLHYAADLGCSKPAAAFYRAIEARTGLRPDQLLLVDDRRENVDGAIACGWAARLWTRKDSLASLIADLS